MLYKSNTSVAVKQFLFDSKDVEMEILTMARLQEESPHPHVLSFLGVVFQTEDKDHRKQVPARAPFSKLSCCCVPWYPPACATLTSNPHLFFKLNQSLQKGGSGDQVHGGRVGVRLAGEPPEPLLRQ